ncbi:unnamed protein product [Fusarium equiseti]|uniref:Uncharacterized protein n=1 Tax=Fusarium equiseti TaxID=61235 RepID=A0A8J2J8X6_FUSEQ|nr:unnamed protein product [Fusarium equiseti]
MSESRGVKRPSQGASSSQSTKRRGRPAKADVEQNEVAKQWAQILFDNTEPLVKEDIDQLVGFLHKPPGDNWSAEDEARVDEMWANSPEKEAKARIGHNSHAHLLSTWKLCLRTRRHSPVWLISTHNRLRYFRPGLGDRDSEPIYSKSFCSALAPLLVHPCMRMGVDRLVIILQYAIITRIDNREAWADMEVDGNTCPVLLRIVAMIKDDAEKGENRSLHSVHTSVREEMEAEGNTPTRLSDILYRVGQVVLDKTFSLPQPPESFSPYLGGRVLPLTTEDLMNVREAIDSTDWPDNRYNCTAEEALESYKLIRRSIELPNARELAEHYERAQKELLRDYVSTSRGRPPADEIPRPSDPPEDSALSVPETMDNLRDRSPSLGFPRPSTPRPGNALSIPETPDAFRRRSPSQDVPMYPPRADGAYNIAQASDTLRGRSPSLGCPMPSTPRVDDTLSVAESPDAFRFRSPSLGIPTSSGLRLPEVAGNVPFNEAGASSSRQPNLSPSPPMRGRRYLEKRPEVQLPSRGGPSSMVRRRDVANPLPEDSSMASRIEERLSQMADTQQRILDRLGASANVSPGAQLQELQDRMNQKDIDVRLLREEVVQLKIENRQLRERLTQLENSQ